MQEKVVAKDRIIKISLAVFCVMVGLALGMVLRGVDRAMADSQMNSEHSKALGDLETAFSAISDKVSGAVVYVKTNSTMETESRTRMLVPPGMEDLFKNFQFETPYGENGPRTVERSGTGMIIREDGYILTNDHVVGDADKVTVVLKDGREFDGKVTRDFAGDVAVIKIDAKNLPTVEFADSDEVRVGQWAIAIGNPLGLTHSMTVGIISAKYRQEGVDSGNQPRFYPELLQTDASINQGNSGGPLLDIDGKVIGMNTLIMSPTGGNIGVGFAIPSNQVKYLADQLIDKGVVNRGFLGVLPANVTPERAKRFGVESGAVLEQVTEDTPAAKAGLEPGDVVTEIDGKKVANALDLRNIIARAKPGATVDIIIVRDKKERTVKVELGTAPDLAKGDTTTEPVSSKDNILGIGITALTSQRAKELKVPADMEGVVVESVKPSSSAAQVGLTPGYVLYRINDAKVSSVKEFDKIVKDLKPGETVVLYLRAGNRSMMLDFRLSE